MTKRAWLLFALVTALCGAVGYASAPLPSPVLLQVIEGLRSTSAIVFGAMGAWLALLYATTTEQTRDRGWRGRVAHVLISMALSGLVLAAVVAIAFGTPILARIDVVTQNRTTVLRLGLAATGALTAVQLWSVLLSFLPLLWWSRSLLVDNRNEEKRLRYLGAKQQVEAGR